MLQNMKPPVGMHNEHWHIASENHVYITLIVFVSWCAPVCLSVFGVQPERRGGSVDRAGKGFVIASLLLLLRDNNWRWSL